MSNDSIKAAIGFRVAHDINARQTCLNCVHGQLDENGMFCKCYGIKTACYGRCDLHKEVASGKDK